MDYEHPTKDRCSQRVGVPDTYRYTGRGKSGFEMHYSWRQCSRKPGPSGYCWQHEPRIASPQAR